MTNSPERLRRKAKKLKRAFAAGDTEAIARARTVLGARQDLKYSAALHVIAVEEGFASWPRLKIAYEAGRMDRDARAERLKIALYLGQNWIVEALLDADPSLPDHNLGLACALGDTGRVKEAIAADPTAATHPVGLRSPLLHAVFSRHHRVGEDAAAGILETVAALVTSGADVNDSYPAEPGSEHRLSALYGALGHAGNLPLAEWLLDRGADPNDNESLYHATELPTLDGVRLLMKHGVRTSGTNALPRMLDFDNLEGVRLLLDYGANPNEAVLDHPSGQPIDTIPALHQAARRGRSGAFATLLLEYGADPAAIWEGYTAYALARVYGNHGFAEAMETAGHSETLSAVDGILAACADGAPRGRLDRESLNQEQSRILSRVVLWEDHLDHAKALVAVGIDPNVTDEMGVTPLQLAAWAGLREQTAWLLTLSPDLDHINDYGGDLIGTIIHGSENRLDSEERDHVECLRLAFQAGAVLRRRDLDGAMDEDVVAFLSDWAEAHPERIVDYG